MKIIFFSIHTSRFFKKFRSSRFRRLKIVLKSFSFQFLKNSWNFFHSCNPYNSDHLSKSSKTKLKMNFNCSNANEERKDMLSKMQLTKLFNVRKTAPDLERSNALTNLSVARNAADEIVWREQNVCWTVAFWESFSTNKTSDKSIWFYRFNRCVFRVVLNRWSFEITVLYSRQQISWFVAFLKSLSSRLSFVETSQFNLRMHKCIDQCEFITACWAQSLNRSYNYNWSKHFMMNWTDHWWC